MKNKPDQHDTLLIVLICLCLLVVACVETFTSSFLNDSDDAPTPETTTAASAK